MKYFLETVDTIEAGHGFSHYGVCHILWITAFILMAVVCCIIYRKSGENRRKIFRRIVAALIVADELFKMLMLTIGGNYTLEYLPLHLCSINIFLIAIHSFKPFKVLDNFLYYIGLPAAVAALLFPSWASLPPANFMHIHSFTVHILLALYPLMLTIGGDIKPNIKLLPKLLLLLVCMAVPIYFINILCDSNYMFLMYADPGNPLLWFEENWGSHLLGYPVLITAVLAVMSAPFPIISAIIRNRKEKNN